MRVRVHPDRLAGDRVQWEEVRYLQIGANIQTITNSFQTGRKERTQLLFMKMI